MPADPIELTVAVTANHVFVLEASRHYQGLRVRAHAMFRGLPPEPGIYRVAARPDPRNPSFLDVLRYEEVLMKPSGIVITVEQPEETADADRDQA